MKKLLVISSFFLIFSCIDSKSEHASKSSSEQLNHIKTERNQSLDTEKPIILNFGMNKSKVIWVRAENLTNAVNIVIDGQIIQSKVDLKKNSVTAKLPEAFDQNKRVDVSLVDVANDEYSESLKGMLNVDESYLLNLKRKDDAEQENNPQISFSELDLFNYREEMVLSNFGMNKSKTIWVKTDKITDSSVILLDSSLLITKAHPKDNSLTAKLPESFTSNKKVTMQIVDPELKRKSNVLNGLLNVEEIYLLNLSKK